jgi:hypothetical protein
MSYAAICHKHGRIELHWSGKFYLLCYECFREGFLSLCERVK